MHRTGRTATIRVQPKEVDMVWVIVAFAFVFSVLGLVSYALVRPFTHLGYRHPQGRIFRPLD
jgi:hypothetical protein